MSDDVEEVSGCVERKGSMELTVVQSPELRGIESKCWKKSACERARGSMKAVGSVR